MSIEQIDRRTARISQKPALGPCNSLTFRYCQSGTPLISQNIQADAAVRVDVGVVDAGGEVDLGRLEGIVCREVDG